MSGVVYVIMDSRDYYGPYLMECAGVFMNRKDAQNYIDTDPDCKSYSTLIDVQEIKLNKPD